MLNVPEKVVHHMLAPVAGATSSSQALWIRVVGTAVAHISWWITNRWTISFDKPYKLQHGDQALNVVAGTSIVHRNNAQQLGSL